MILYNSRLWLSDIDEIIEAFPELSKLNNNSVLITGATGLIGTAIIELLLRYNDTYDGSIRVYAAGRRLESMHSRFGAFIDRDDFSCVSFDATSNDNNIDIECNYIIYGASNAIPSYVIKEPVETMLCNFTGLKEFLDYVKDNNVKRLLYISSSEVYGKKNDNLPYKENDFGYIDLLNPRNSYSISKRSAETLCVSYGEEYGIDTVIVRPGHIYGPTALQRDIRVSSSWAYDAAMGRNIVMKSNGSQIRSYCYCLDCASAIIKVMLFGESLEAYNISNPNSILSIKQLAEILCDAGNVELEMELPNDVEIRQFNPMNISSLEGSKLQRLGWNGLFDGVRGLFHTVRILKEISG